MTQDQLNAALRGRTIQDVQLLEDGSARIVLEGQSLEIHAFVDYRVDPTAPGLGLRVLEGGQ